MMNWKLPHWATVIGATFGGAALSIIKNEIATGEFPQTSAQWQSLAVAAVSAGVAAVFAMYITPPGKIALTVDPTNDKNGTNK
jgi:hypothetical protein